MRDLPEIILLKKHGSIKKALRSKKIAGTQENINIFWLRVCEQRYKYDFEFFAIYCITIIDKQTAEPIPFKLNPAQRMLLVVFEKMRKQGIQITVQVLKAKQMGFSTLTQMYMKWIQIIHRKNWNSVVCAHTRDAAINVRSMYEKSIKKMPIINGIQYDIKGFGTTQNIKEITENGSLITVGFANEPDSVRSQNVKMVHFSEEAFYPTTENNNPALLESSIISSSTKGAYTMIVRESTANGVGDYFYEEWQKAKAQETAYEAVFAPWFMIKLYEELFDKTYWQHNGRKKSGTVEQFISTLNDYELNLWKNNRLCTLENLNWRRMMAATMPNESKMKQEFPSDDIEAFQDSGSPAFNSEQVEKLREECYAPDEIGTLISEIHPTEALIDKKKRRGILNGLKFVPDSEALNLFVNGEIRQRHQAGLNKLQIWCHPETKNKYSNYRYVVAFDPQKGTSKYADYGIIKVFDRLPMKFGDPPTVAAIFYGHTNMYVTIWLAAQIAKYYCNALLVIEKNTYVTDKNTVDMDDYIFDVIADEYQHLYCHKTSPDKIVEGAPRDYGFPMFSGEKMMIIEQFRTILSERGYGERDSETLNEARTFEEKGNGKYGAKEGKHDDRIMCTMMGLWVCYDLPLPKLITPTSGGNVHIQAW